ncbi:MAG TPA: hypothetical protein VMS55_18330 [Myxococcota bacterium]|nr:hypothetical protein [Myxococcota bacterium]
MRLARFGRFGFRFTILAALGALSHAAPAAAQLALAVEANPGVAVPGEQLEVQVTVSNPTVANVAAVVLNVAIPTDIDPFNRILSTSVSGGCNQVVNDSICQSGETIIWNLGTMLAGQSFTVSLHPTVAAAAVGPIAFNATLSTGGAASASVSVDAARTVQLAVHELRDPVAAGDEIAYTLHFGNSSTTNTAPNASLSLPLPAGTTFVSASDGGVFGAGTVTWALGTLQPGDSGTRTLVLDANAGLARGSLLLVQAELTDTSGQLARARAVTEIDGAEPLSLGMALRPDPVRVGEQIDLELTLTNTSLVNVGGVGLVLRWPQEIAAFNRIQATSVSGGCNQIVNDSVCQGGEFIVWNLGTMTAGHSITVTIAMDLASIPDGSVVDFDAFALSAGEDRVAVDRALVVDSARQLELGVHEREDPIAAGGELVYTLHFGNASTTDTAPNATLAFPLPAGTTFVSASDGGSLNAGTVSWSLGTLQPGQSGTRTLVLDADAGLARGSLIRAQAELSDTSAVPQRARVRTVTEVDGSEPLALGMALRPDPVGVGEQIDLELTLTNTSLVDVGGTTLMLRFPEEIAAFNRVLATSVSGGCNQIVNDVLCQSGEFIVWNLGTMTAGHSITVTIAMDLASIPDGSVVDFDAFALSAGEDRVAVDRALAVDSARRLQLSMHEERDPVAPGSQFVYTLHFGNSSTTDTAPNATLAFPLPSGTTFVSASDGGSLNAGTVSWSLGTLQPGQAGTRTLVLDANAGLARGSLILAQAELSDTSAIPQRARIRTVTEIDGSEPLALGMALRPDPVGVGEQIDLELTLTNTSLVDVGGTTLVLRFPEEIAAFNRVLATSVTGGCNQLVNDVVCQGGEFIVWNGGTLLAGQSFTVSVPVSLAAIPNGAIVDFDAFALSAGEDRVAVDRALAVDSSRTLQLGLEENRDPVAPGSQFVYTLHFGNSSTTDTAPNATLAFPLPSGASFVDASDGGSFNAGTVSWSLGTLPTQSTGSRNVTVAADAGLARASLLLPKAELSDASAIPRHTRSNAVTEIDGAEALSTQIGFHTATSFDVFVTNTTAVNHTGVTLSLRLPQQIQTFSRLTIPNSGGCNQLVNDTLCQGGEYVLWNIGTVLAGQHLQFAVPSLVPTGPAGSLFELSAIALGSTTEDRAVDKVVPEPGFAASLFAGIGLLVVLAKRRSR